MLGQLKRCSRRDMPRDAASLLLLDRDADEQAHCERGNKGWREVLLLLLDDWEADLSAAPAARHHSGLVAVSPAPWHRCGCGVEEVGAGLVLHRVDFFIVGKQLVVLF